MNLKEKQNRAAKIHAEQKALLAEIGADWQDDGEKETKYTALKDERAKLEAAIAREQELLESENRLRVVPDPNAGATERTEGKLPAQAKGEQDPSYGFRSPREFLTAVIQAGTGRMDDRLKPLATAGSDEQSGLSDAYGNFLVPPAYTTDVKMVDPEADPTAGRTMQIPMTSKVVNIPARVDKNHTSSVSGGLSVSRRAETGAASSSRMELEQVELKATGVFGLAYASEEILTDSPVSFAALLSQGFRDEFSSHMLGEKLDGTGVGEYEGVHNSPALVTVTKETNQNADTIEYTNLIKIRSRVWRYGSAIWLANHDTLPQLMLMNQTIGTSGVPVWQPSGREDHPDLLLGRPIFFTEYQATLGDAHDIGCYNFSQYLEGTYEGLQSAESMHVRFVNHERTFKFWTRNAGKSWWRSALTPKNSTATLSPFVVLGARA